MKLLLQIRSILEHPIRFIGDMIIGLLDYIVKLLDEHKMARRILLLWGVILVTGSVTDFWDHIEHFDHPETVMVAIIGLIGVVIGFYQKSRHKDDEQ